MKLKKFEDNEVKPYPAGSSRNTTGRVALGKKEGAQNYVMRILELGQEGCTAFHTHDWEHEVFIHQGTGQVLGNGEWQDFKPGDTVFVSPNEEHQFKNTGDEPVLMVCVIPAGPPEF